MSERVTTSAPTPAKDPICGKEVDPLRARAVGIFGGVTYYFCSAECKARFQDPRRSPREPTREQISPKKKRDAAPPPAESAPSPSPAREEAAFDEAALDDDLVPAGQAVTRAWLVALFLVAVAAAVLYFALER